MKKWGIRSAETKYHYPCDNYPSQIDDVYYRAVSIKAKPAIIFRWLCQMKLAPYSYDLIDNLGRKSPRELIKGVDHLAIGDRFMLIFNLVEFEPDKQLTITFNQDKKIFKLLGETAITYMLKDEGETTRLIVKLSVRYGIFPINLLQRAFLPLGDLIMMRKQLLTFKYLAER